MRRVDPIYLLHQLGDEALQQLPAQVSELLRRAACYRSGDEGALRTLCRSLTSELTALRTSRPLKHRRWTAASVATLESYLTLDHLIGHGPEDRMLELQGGIEIICVVTGGVRAVVAHRDLLKRKLSTSESLLRSGSAAVELGGWLGIDMAASDTWIVCNSRSGFF